MAWDEAKSWFDEQTELIGADFYNYIVALAKKFGWEYGSEIAGHLIGHFPHERLEPGNYNLYVHPQNYTNMLCRNNDETERNWILEIHFIDKGKKIGSFFEQLLT